MMEDKIVRQYVRAVSRKLICSKATRSKLLNGLKQELSAYSELSYNELCAKVGNPEQIAEQLLESVDETEIAVIAGCILHTCTASYTRRFLFYSF